MGARGRAARSRAIVVEHTTDEIGDNLHLDTICVGVSLRTAVVDVHSAEIARDGTSMGGVEISDGGTGAASCIAHDLGEEL